MTARAAYACQPEASRGRLYPEAESPTRTCFQRDRDRVIHSTAFRRLKHKTQVFVYHEGDHYRTRLTHSLEVAQIARGVARGLGLDEDLCEALALAHDLGHPPFGHAGEEALDKAMAPFGGFDHNAQTLRVLTRLEHRYAEFDGLNLCWETLEGVVKHNGPVSSPYPFGIADYARHQDLELTTHASAEAQVAAQADDIAYNNHDIDDGLRAGLFQLEDFDRVPLVGRILREVSARYPRLDRPRLVHETIRRLIDRMVTDLLAESRRRLADLAPKDAQAIRAAGRPTIGLSAEMAKEAAELKEFLYLHMYRHYKVNRMTSKAKRIVTDLFGLYLSEPEVLPEEWRAQCRGPGTTETARVAADFVAGMTDRFAYEEHARLFDLHTKI
ncbi:MAG: deoxyguanosinetriphosphate triphosphohydrolase [Alphaproteobacteria bacterium]|nr:deoxyguanosinetriphosphate triphosphohydrolase [Alphaproteobacteria bacterium]